MAQLDLSKLGPEKISGLITQAKEMMKSIMQSDGDGDSLKIKEKMKKVMDMLSGWIKYQTKLISNLRILSYNEWKIKIFIEAIKIKHKWEF